MKEVLILGASGQLGSELSLLFPDAIKLHHTNHGNNLFELENREELLGIILKQRPKVILNAAALVNADTCEKEKKRSLMVNGESIKTLVQAAREIGAILLHVSTDYVFDGTEGSYAEDGVPNPINYYGLSKLVGDIYALSYEDSIVVRTSGVFGHAKNFPIFVYESLKNNRSVNAIPGFYSPIHARLLARAMFDLTQSDFRGLINIAGDKISRCELARSIAKRFGLNADLVSESESVPWMVAKRPFDSSLNVSLGKKLLNFDFSSIEPNLDTLADTV